MGITVSRRVGASVVRNRVKRRLREVLRLLYPRLCRGWDLVLVVRPAAAEATYQDLAAAAHSLLRRADLVSTTAHEPQPASA